MTTDIRGIAETLNKELKESGMRISLIPEFRIKHGIYSLIDNARDSELMYDEETEKELFCFEDIAGDYSDEPDNNVLEVLLTDESIEFWSILLKTQFSEAPEFAELAINAMTKAKELGFNYLKFTQY